MRRQQFSHSNILKTNELEIDLLSKTVKVNDTLVILTKSEYELLLFLIGNRNRVVSKNAIAEHLSGDMADLDEVIEYRTEEFISSTLPQFTKEDVDQWNRFNEDMVILRFDTQYPLNQIVEEAFFSKAEGHTIFYRVRYTEISIEGKPYVLAARIPMIEFHDLLRMLIAQYGVIFVILVICLSLVNLYVSKRLWQPFYKTLDKIERFSLDSGKELNFDTTHIREFLRLNEQLTKLIKENLRIYKQQKEFVENASHELQTPLAVFQSQLDTLLQQPNLTKKEIDIIQSLYSTASRMARLNKNLLLLAKMDNEQFEQRANADFVKVLSDQLSSLKELAESNGINVTVDINATFTVYANAILLESLIMNLIVNAIRHNNDANGRIHIGVDKNIFSISNTGQKKALDADKIFRRFSRTTEEKIGNGLGLSIVQQICKLHGWKVSYDYKNDEHVFVVRFLCANNF